LIVRDNSFFQNERTTILSGNGPAVIGSNLLLAISREYNLNKIGAIELRLRPGSTPINGPGLYRFESFEATNVPENSKFSVFVFGGALLAVFITCGERKSAGADASITKAASNR
jgi:hypothetical protein